MSASTLKPHDATRLPAEGHFARALRRVRALCSALLQPIANLRALDASFIAPSRNPGEQHDRCGDIDRDLADIDLAARCREDLGRPCRTDIGRHCHLAAEASPVVRSAKPKLKAAFRLAA